ncbi:MAG: aromatic amino acid hydroxylase [Holophagaceae bacterium]
MTPTEKAISQLPDHLRPYVVRQDYSQYTPRDHAVWRHILTRLQKTLKKSAHPDYLDGLLRTGISVNRIPSLDEMNLCLKEIGWTAVAVRGFIPPSVFTELQSRRVLAIAEDIRDHRHIGYTPAPDIVHESAGHSPILINHKYATYVQRCGLLGFKAISSKEDFLVFEAIRHLSIVKENPNSTQDQILEAEERLVFSRNSHRYVSENTKASRLYWWTAEYGMVGELDHPKLYGAGLLSSIEEAEHALTDSVKKYPLTLACIEKAYDITTMQPQLFVAKDFEHLFDILEQFEATLSYTRGGIHGLSEAKKAESIVHLKLDNDRFLSGQVAEYYPISSGAVACMSGPSLLEINEKEYQFNKEPILFFWDQSSSNERFVNLTFDQYYLHGSLENGYLRNIRTNHPRLKEIFKQGSSQVICSSTLTSIAGGPANPTLWEELVPTNNSFTYEEGELIVRRAKIKDLDPALGRIYEELNRMILDGQINPIQLGTLAKVASQFPSEWLLHSQLDFYMSNQEIP